ncbi:hypothetical protein NLG07_01195 [Alteromonas sp. LMIT006]|jgi:hypothetical protein|uniref:hypothetical protein n=1 Tax=Alteromonadaceae TaxID=72275 RepID=UPI0020CA7656|nr:hypothetical protein [Alteromonas sp. LMIT006]UTP72883.1 hypothetical protein NLG07_01195 [Alteromonas sp. LMIT006]
MQKIVIIISVIIAVIAGGIWYVFSQTDTLIKQQVEQRGSEYLGTKVSLGNAELSLSDGRLSLSDLNVQNPQGFSQNNALSLQLITLDLGAPRGDAYVVDQFVINVPEILYETDNSTGSNLLTIKDHIQSKLPRKEATPTPTKTAQPMMIIDDIVIDATRLKLDFSALPVEQLGVEQTAYAITLPSFHLGAIGQPNGIPADQIGAAVTDALLTEVIRIAKAEAKKAAKDAARDKINEALDKQKDKLKDKMKDKLKDLMGG